MLSSGDAGCSAQILPFRQACLIATVMTVQQHFAAPGLRLKDLTVSTIRMWPSRGLEGVGRICPFIRPVQGAYRGKTGV